MRANGKTTQIKLLKGAYSGGSFKAVTVHGREESTNSEVARNFFFLQLLQGVATLRGRSLINHIWFPRPGMIAPKKRGDQGPALPIFRKLNDSQRAVASAMVSTSENVVIAHGRLFIC